MVQCEWYSPVARIQSWHVGLYLAGQYCMAGNIMQYDSMQWYSPVARSQSWHVGLYLAGQYCMAGNIM